MKALPITWTVSSLHTVCDIVRGITFPASAKQFEKDDLNICCLRTSNIQREIRWEDVYFIPRQYVKQDAQFVQIGDILMSMANSYELVGKVAIARMLPYETAFGAFLSAIRPRDVIFGQYLFHFLRSDATQHEIRVGSSQTTNIANISVRTLSTVKIPLPSLNEQKRIANKLDSILARVDACRERLDRIPAILKRFRQAVLYAGFTGKLTDQWRSQFELTPVLKTLLQIKTPPRPNRFSSISDRIIDGDYALSVGNPKRKIPEGWVWTLLIDVARMESGHTPSRSHPEYWGGSIPWIGIADARDSHAHTIKDTYQHTNDVGLTNSAARLLPAGTVCLSRTASVGYVVKMGVAMATSQDFANWICTEAINPDWLKFLFVAERDAIYRFGKGSTHTTVYYPELMAFHVALPPIEEQTEIVRRVEELFAYADRIETRYHAARARVDKLTPAILAKAFRGELVPQDPNDEPASVLLERIRASRAENAATPKPKRSRTIASCKTPDIE